VAIDMVQNLSEQCIQKMNSLEQLIEGFQNRNYEQIERNLQLVAENKQECRQLIVDTKQECVDTMVHTLSHHTHQNKELMAKLIDDTMSYAQRQSEEGLRRATLQTERVMDEILQRTSQQSERILAAVTEMQRRQTQFQSQVDNVTIPKSHQLEVVEQPVSKIGCDRRSQPEPAITECNVIPVRAAVSPVELTSCRVTGNVSETVRPPCRRSGEGLGHNVGLTATNRHDETSLWDTPITPILSRHASAASLANSFNTARSVPSVCG